MSHRCLRAHTALNSTNQDDVSSTMRVGRSSSIRVDSSTKAVCGEDPLFLALSVELRNRIYKLVFSNVCVAVPCKSRGNRMGALAVPGLLLANRQIYNETNALFYSTATFTLLDPLYHHNGTFDRLPQWLGKIGARKATLITDIVLRTRRGNCKYPVEGLIPWKGRTKSTHWKAVARNTVSTVRARSALARARKLVPQNSKVRPGVIKVEVAFDLNTDRPCLHFAESELATDDGDIGECDSPDYDSIFSHLDPGTIQRGSLQNFKHALRRTDRISPHAPSHEPCEDERWEVRRVLGSKWTGKGKRHVSYLVEWLDGSRGYEPYVNLQDGAEDVIADWHRHHPAADGPPSKWAPPLRCLPVWAGGSIA